MADAEALLSQAVDAFRAALGDRLLAAYALGSLAHGGFSALVSDVDLGLILADPLQSRDGEMVEAIAESQRSTGLALAKRLSVFWGTPATLRGEGEGGRFPPLDRLDLIENGRLLAGIDERVGFKRPTADELLINGAEFALDFLAGLPSGSSSTPSRLGSMRPAAQDAIEEIRDPSVLLARGVRRVTKLVLFPVRFMFTAATGRVATNEEAVRWYLAAADVPAKSLVSDALVWRAAAWRDPSAAAALLRDQLVPLYLQYVDDHIERLAAAGEPELARGFEQWRCRLTRDAGPRSAASPDTA